MAIYDRHEWLAGRVESAIDPDRPIIDPHHHLWDRDDSRYLAQELRTDARSSHNVTHTVFVECSAAYDPVICGPVADDTMAPVGETRFVAEQAAESLRLGGPEIAGIVGHVDLTMGERVGEVLAEHDARGAGLFRGVRHGTNWSPHADVKNGHHQPGPHLLANPDFRAGVAHARGRWLHLRCVVVFRPDAGASGAGGWRSRSVRSCSTTSVVPLVLGRTPRSRAEMASGVASRHRSGCGLSERGPQGRRAWHGALLRHAVGGSTETPIVRRGGCLLE